MITALLLLALQAPSQEAGSGYRLPPPEVVAIVDAPETPSVQLSPDGRSMVLVERAPLPPIVDVVRPWVGLAGVRIDTQLGARQALRTSTGLLVRPLVLAEGEQPRRIALGEDPRIGEVLWSHDSRRFAFTLRAETLELWTADVESGEAVRLVTGLNNVLTSGFEWLPDGRRLACLVVPPKRGAAPVRPATPTGPAVQETAGTRSPVPTYTDMLEDEFDERLFEHYAAAQLVVIDGESGAQKAIGAPGLYSSVECSPDSHHFLVTRLERPFSHLLPYDGFARTIEVWSEDGRKEHVVAQLPAAENVPIEGVPLGPRMVQWQATADARLVWADALDGGDPAREAEFRDRWMALDTPFEAAPRELLRLAHRARGVTWLVDPNKLLVTEYDRDLRWLHMFLCDLTTPDAAPLLVENRSARDRYGDPGRLVMTVDARGQYVVRQDGNWVYRTGPGDSPGGARPFLHRHDLAKNEVQRLWRAAPGSYESAEAIVASTPAGEIEFVSVYESPTEPPNWRLRRLPSNEVVALTEFADPTPQLRGIQKQLLTYEREDGVQLSATLYLPAGYEAGERLPLVVWAYPLEYNDAGTAGQVSGSPFRFTRIRGASQLFFLTQGYAVMDDATMPIVGDPATMNDTFIEQIVASAKAAIAKAAELGVADPERVGVGGHSYGAFMTANLLAHSDLFAAGIARSGAYNRTLTPFGFQSERRTLWEAPEIYAAISPFMHAEKINEPLLLIHGERDSNSGTFPIQSERMYQAIKGQGGTCRYVVLPGEGHGYAARESVMHTLAEMIEWFDLHVKQRTAHAGGPIEAGSER